MQNLTELEVKVLNAIKEGDDFDGMPCEGIENLKDETGLSTKVLRGVLSSLQNKNLVITGEYPNGATAFFYQEEQK